MTIDRSFEMVPELKEIYQKEKDIKEIIDMAKKIEGCARHISVHAAGVVISPSDITEYVPLQYDPKGEGKIITQYDMHSVEDAGLLKFDFLGLKNLSILADTVDRIRAIEGKIVDPEKIPLDDPRTFSILSRGETEGLFQLNGEGMTKFLKDLKPTSIHDINAMVALYRPGPMEVIPEYIRRKNDSSLISYPDPRMEKYLEESYGLIVYQDDLLLSAIELAGYSWLEADKFRKAVGKKIPAEMAAQKEKLIRGIINHGQTKAFAEKLWKLFEPFQAYGFNKAHAASYGRVAYQTAYFKANYPAIYMSAVLTADSGDVEKIGVFINECKRMSIPVLPPSVNESFRGFSVVREASKPDKIRFGLATIKNFGEGISQAIVHERKANGEFKSLADFLERIKDRNLNKKSLESLIKTGALDEFGERGEMMANLENLLVYHKESAQEIKSQDSLFGLMADISTVPRLTLVKSPPATDKEKLTWEKELLGLYISGHPLDQYKGKLEERSVNITRIKKEFPNGLRATVAGIIEEAREIITKGNERMMFVKIADLSDSMEIVVFPRVLNEYKNIIKPESCVVVVGSVSKRNNSTSIIAEKVRIF
jgi:DNA polymerase-3 subunit alpha